MIDWTELLSQLLMAVLTIVIPALAAYAAKWLKAKADAIVLEAEAFAPDWADALREVAMIAVGAAEQSKLAGLIEDKREYAFEIAEKWLLAKGFDIDIDLIYAAIEREVIQQFPKKQAEE
jgi:hypothetical protein